jgi:hypothetical protein
MGYDPPTENQRVQELADLLERIAIALEKLASTVIEDKDFGDVIQVKERD